MELEVLDLWREICITRASYRDGPWILIMHISRQKSITSRSIKTTGALTLSLTAHLMLLISLQSYKLAPPKKDDIMQIADYSDDVMGADL